jgi:hypothetical protein
MEDMLWIEDIVKSTPTLPFLSNFRIDMTSFGDPHKVVGRKNAFSAFSKCTKIELNLKVG